MGFWDRVKVVLARGELLGVGKWRVWKDLGGRALGSLPLTVLTAKV